MKNQEIVTVEFTRVNNMGSTTIVKDFPKQTVDKIMKLKNKPGMWKNARVVTKPVEVDLGLKTTSEKSEEKVKGKPGPKPKPVETESEENETKAE